VNADGHTTGSGGMVVAQQGALTALVELARGVQRQRTSGNDEAAMQGGADIKSGHRGIQSEWVY
jgi:hypothetical protein